MSESVNDGKREFRLVCPSNLREYGVEIKEDWNGYEFTFRKLWCKDFRKRIISKDGLHWAELKLGMYRETGEPCFHLLTGRRKARKDLEKPYAHYLISFYMKYLAGQDRGFVRALSREEFTIDGKKRGEKEFLINPSISCGAKATFSTHINMKTGEVRVLKFWFQDDDSR